MSSPNVDPITTIDSPLLIIAGPGAGKTFTLVERTLHLVESGVESENVMVATFTEKAAKELITRVSNRLIDLNYKVNLNEMYIGTLHSIFLRILEENREYTRLKRSYRVLDDFDQKYFVYRYINRVRCNPKFRTTSRKPYNRKVEKSSKGYRLRFEDK